MDWMLMPLRRYADFQGRSRRKEYWMYFLLVMIVVVVLAFVEGMLGINGMVGGVYGPLTTLVLVATFVPNLAVGVRRLHDSDKSGWLMLLGLIPFVGGLILLVLFCLEGTKGPNRFGPDPKSENLATVFN